MIALVLALIGLAAGEFTPVRSRHLDPPTATALWYAGAAMFLAFGLIAAFGLSVRPGTCCGRPSARRTRAWPGTRWSWPASSPSWSLP